jgi:hypothetical protein
MNCCADFPRGAGEIGLRLRQPWSCPGVPGARVGSSNLGSSRIHARSTMSTYINNPSFTTHSSIFSDARPSRYAESRNRAPAHKPKPSFRAARRPRIWSCGLALSMTGTAHQKTKLVSAEYCTRAMRAQGRWPPYNGLRGSARGAS